jgi:hypothetical protein
MLVLAQLVAVAHFILVSHSISQATGKLVHAQDPHSHRQKNDDGHPPHRGPPEDECQVFAVMHQAALLPVSGPTLTAPVVDSDHVRVLATETPLVSQRALYVLAPSRSPPAWLA